MSISVLKIVEIASVVGGVGVVTEKHTEFKHRFVSAIRAQL